MLILTRREGETVRIGNDIEVTITDIRSNRVRIRIDAPIEVNVVRRELLESEHRPHRLKGSVLVEWSAVVDQKGKCERLPEVTLR